MAALLGAWTLIFDVIARHADFHEAADQIANVRIAAVAGVGIGDDERPEIMSRATQYAAPRSSANADIADCDPR